MTKPIVYFAPWCPNTEEFFAMLDGLGIQYEALDMTGVREHCKAFLKLRDTHPVFDDAKENGYIGIPALVLPTGEVVLDKDKLKEIFGRY